MTRILPGIFLVLAGPALGGAEEIDFNRDIRPILSDKCFHCHGPDARNQRSDLRLDTREHALADLGGFAGIVPGDPGKSELHARIRLPSGDPDAMPPADSNRILTPREKDLLDAWIEQGAPYDVHWSFQPIERPAPPRLLSGDLEERSLNPIDRFLFARLEKETLQPSSRATLETRLRRASLTLTGLPPSVDAVDRALAQPHPSRAYEDFVDDRLASIDYAERQALRWLSAARYADTDGYQVDSARSNWPWRDWVISAFHENLPFDRFTIEQLAGDMLPGATPGQVLASAFNRNHRQNAEGGALAEEFFVENVIDRVETTSTVWLGLTMGCARCHDHKYDPVTQREFFQLYAYFNNIGERGTGRGFQANPVESFRSPLVEPPAALLTALEQAQSKEAEVARAFSTRRDAWIAATAASLERQELDWRPQESFSRTGVENAVGRLETQADSTLVFEGKGVTSAVYRIGFLPSEPGPVTGIRLDALPDPAFSAPRQLARSVNGNFVLTGVTVTAVKGENGNSRPLPIAAATATFEQENYPIANTIDDNRKTGWAVFGPDAQPETVSAFFFFTEPAILAEGEEFELRLAHESQFADHNIGKLRLSLTSSATAGERNTALLPDNLLAVLAKPSDERSGEEVKALTEHYRTIDEEAKRAERDVSRAEKALAAVGAESVPVMVMSEREGEPAPAYFLERGQYNASDRSEALPRAVPAALFQGEEGTQPADRLELAQWIASDRNPLTARVIVNRIWQDHFGVGLVKTSEDFGLQSEPPSHPGLLDWLAAEFIESGWNMKHIHRLIVTSETFQQGSAVDSTLLHRDPENRLLARGPRYRLDGFAIRDLSLHASGLLDPRVGGAPVKPYQPEGLWSSLANRATSTYTPSTGADLYRKSLYTFWKRSVNPPRQLIFDAGGREACDVGVRRTNTPLQALVLMNDVTFLEAARHLAETVLREKPAIEPGLARLYRRATALQPDAKQLAILGDSLAFFTEHFTGSPDEAGRFLDAGESPRDESIPASEHAAWTAVAHLILNLDTTISVQ